MEKVRGTCADPVPVEVQSQTGHLTPHIGDITAEINVLYTCTVGANKKFPFPFHRTAVKKRNGLFHFMRSILPRAHTQIKDSTRHHVYLNSHRLTVVNYVKYAEVARLLFLFCTFRL